MNQPPSGPPEGPPWGHYPPPGSQPKRGRRAEIFGGVVIGGILAVIVPVVGLAIAAGSGSDSGSGAVAVLIVAILLVPVVGLGLLFSESSRPWGVGILIGWAIALIVIGGSCVALIASLDGSL